MYIWLVKRINKSIVRRPVRNRHRLILLRGASSPSSVRFPMIWESRRGDEIFDSWETSDLSHSYPRSAPLELVDQKTIVRRTHVRRHDDCSEMIARWRFCSGKESSRYMVQEQSMSGEEVCFILFFWVFGIEKPWSLLIVEDPKHYGIVILSRYVDPLDLYWGRYQQKSETSVRLHRGDTEHHP